VALVDVAPVTATPTARSTRPTSLPHLPALDGLRGLAVAGVLMFHATHLKGGFLGVDLFFTLSGFLITTLLLTEHARTGRISLKSFWGRRARRLFPAVIALLLAVAGYTAIWGRPSDYPGVRWDGITALFYLANWRSILSGNGYWDQFKPKSPFDHLWSLSIEEQFYVLWPLVVALCLWKFRGRLRPLAIVTVGAMWGSVVAMVFMHTNGDDPNRVYMGTDTRIASILAGAVVAILVARFPQRMGSQPRRNDVIGVAALGVLLASWFVIDGVKAEWLYEGGLFGHAMLTALVIGIAYGRRGGVLARVLAIAPLRWLGRVSYGLYLWHWPVYWAMNPARMGITGWPLTAVRLAVSCVIAEVSYRVIEAPIRHGRPKARVALALVPVAAIACVVALLAVTVAPAQPTSASVTPPATIVPVTTTVQTIPVSVDPSASSTTVASTTTTTVAKKLSLITGANPTDVRAALPNLRVPTAANPLRVLLVGDSFMYDAAPGISAALASTGLITVTDDSQQGFTLGKPNWRQIWSDLATPRPELIITMWGTFDTAYYADDPAKYTATFNEAMKVLTASGAAVIILGIPPSTAGGGVNERKIDRTLNKLYREQVSAFSGQIVYVETDPIVAPNGEATLSIDTPTGKQRVRKVDLHHFCSEGSARFGDAMLEVFAQLGVATPSTSTWRDQLWRFEKRYNDPPGACS
jgi:peptidoglycan/LPS O-acetylase OafA/YrhL